MITQFFENALNIEPLSGDNFSFDNTSIHFFGEIYNKKELGFIDSDSNAEILFKHYKNGLDNISRIDGKFSAVIFDNGSTVIIRDHHGVFSQIYYSKSAYSDSLDSLLSLEKKEYPIDSNSLNSFLHIGYIPTPHTAFKGISKLPAGYALIYKDGKQELYKYFHSDNSLKASEKSLEEFTEEYGILHRQAISRRISGKNNIGILLSGGYDSGGNLAALRSIYSGEINSYSIGFKGDNWSELPLAKCMSETFKTNHHEYQICGNEINGLPEIVKSLGDPFVEGGLMVNYAVMKMIGSPTPQIILGGDGSDQYFGTTGREIALHMLISKYGMTAVARLILNLLSNNTFDTGGKAYKIRFHLDKILNILAGDMFGFPEFALKNLTENSNTNNYCISPKCDTKSFENLFTQHAIVSDLEKIINQVILFKASRMASLFNQNLAFPYLDNTLYSFLQTVPVKYKCFGNSMTDIAKGRGVSKFLLKNYYRDKLPKLITEKKKQGGFAPMPLFFKDIKQREKIADYIMSSDILNNYLNKKGVENFIRTFNIDSKESGKWFWYQQSRAIQYFNLFTLTIWWETYVKRNNGNNF